MNKCIFSGRLVADPDIKATTSGTKVANIRIAVRRNYKNQNGEYDSDFISCTSFGNQAELLEKYFKKGQEILVSGHLQNRSWDDENGQKHYATDIILETIDFIGGKSNSVKDEEPNINAIEMDVNVKDTSEDDLPF